MSEKISLDSSDTNANNAINFFITFFCLGLIRCPFIAKTKSMPDCSRTSCNFVSDSCDGNTH